MNGFVKMSRYAGMREDLVQAGGGNSSFKIADDRMIIKASGYQLADMTIEEGYAVVNTEIIRTAFLKAPSMNDLTEQQCNKILTDAFVEGKRPSIETFLHAISGKYTLHTHPIVVNAMTCRKDGIKALSELFPDALLVDYAKPGAELAKAYFKAYKQKTKNETQIFDKVFMQNHGLVVSGDTADEVIEKTEQVVYKIEQYLHCNFSKYHEVTKLWGSFEEKIIWRVTDQNVLRLYKKNGLWAHQFCPDCIVFLGKNILKLTDGNITEQVQKYREKYGEPVILVYNDELYLVADSVKKALEIQSVLSFSAQVMDINVSYEVNLLSDKQQNELINWDAEKYRKNMK